MNIQDLPLDVRNIIFKEIEIREFPKISCVCKEFLQHITSLRASPCFQSPRIVSPIDTHFEKILYIAIDRLFAKHIAEIEEKGESNFKSSLKLGIQKLGFPLLKWTAVKGFKWTFNFAQWISTRKENYTVKGLESWADNWDKLVKIIEKHVYDLDQANKEIDILRASYYESSLGRSVLEKQKKSE